MSNEPKNEAGKVMDAAATEALFKAAKEALPTETRKADLLAHMRRIHYEASLRKGFSKEEALFLCTQMEF